MPNVHLSIEKQRGCGYRKPGGLYLVGGNNSAPCCKLPFILKTCPCCGGGVKQSRGFTWVNTNLFFPPNCITAMHCPLSRIDEQIGLMWVGNQYYTPNSFSKEAAQLGVSKRIAQLPHGVKPSSWVALAHPGAVVQYKSELSTKPILLPGVFMVFQVRAIEYVITGKETNQQLERMEKRGIRLVNVVREGDQIAML